MDFCDDVYKKEVKDSLLYFVSGEWCVREFYLIKAMIYFNIIIHIRMKERLTIEPSI